MLPFSFVVVTTFFSEPRSFSFPSQAVKKSCPSISLTYVVVARACSRCIFLSLSVIHGKGAGISIFENVRRFFSREAILLVRSLGGSALPPPPELKRATDDISLPRLLNCSNFLFSLSKSNRADGVLVELPPSLSKIALVLPFGGFVWRSRAFPFFFPLPEKKIICKVSRCPPALFFFFVIQIKKTRE